MRLSESGKTIFILGAGVMQLPAIRAARAMGWRVIVADGSTEAEGRALADRFVHVDLRDREGIAQAVRRCREDGGVDGVFTAGTDFSATVAWAAQQCGLPGLSFETALNATDKVRMRRVFREHDVPQPDFVELGPDDDPIATAARLPFPLVVKPVDNMGARGVRRIDAPGELEAAVRTAFSFSRSGRVIVEEYVPGPEFSLDALVCDGQPVLCGLAERHIYFEPFFIEMGHTMPAVLDPGTQAAITETFFRGIRALGIDNGAAKGDIKLAPRGPVVGEIAARLSGGYMSGWTFPYASGVELTRQALRLAVGLAPRDLEPREHAFSAERAFISMPGVVETITGLDEARVTPGVRDLFVRVRENGPVEFPKNNVQKCGNIITRAQTRAEAVGRAHEALAAIFIRLKPGVAASDGFLFGDLPAVFHAFRFTQPNNLEAIERLPAFAGDPGHYHPSAPVIICPSGLADDPALDWHGGGVARALSIAQQLSGFRLTATAASGECGLGKVFWRAFLRGGAQGAVYLLDTLAVLAARPALLIKFLEEARC
jgi:biotin carboxylase